MSERLDVLILDDEPIVGKRLKPALAKIGCQVEIFVSPKEALDRIDEKEFDIVVTDIRMDNIDGLQVLEHVVKKSGRTKVIMITGDKDFVLIVCVRDMEEFQHFQQEFCIDNPVVSRFSTSVTSMPISFSTDMTYAQL